MSKLLGKYSKIYQEGMEEEYVDRVCVFMDAEAFRPGSTKMHSINVKLVTVNLL